MLNRILLFFAFLFVGCVSAQDYLEAGKTYHFAALNADGSKEITLSVVFDDAGVATVSRSEKTPSASSRSAFYFLTNAPTSTNYTEDKSAVLNIDDTKNYTYISFDGEIQARVTGATRTTLSCNCVKEGYCDLSYMGSGASQGCLQCTSNEKSPCRKCEVAIRTNGKSLTGSTLLIQAKEVRFAK